MKIWVEKAGDHSANLRIIGKFKTHEDAEKAALTINSLLEVAQRAGEPKKGDYFTQEVLDFMKTSGATFSPEAVESCQYHSPVKAANGAIIVETDDIAIQVFLEAFLKHGGRIEIFSKHDYK